MSGGVPRVVFPEEEEPARSERIAYVAHGLEAIFGWDVVEDAVAMAEVEVGGGSVLVQRHCGKVGAAVSFE